MNSRPLVVHVIHALGVGGLENGLVNVVNGTIADFRHAIVCMTSDRNWRGRLDPSVDVVALHRRPGLDWRAFARLVGTLRRFRPAIVHSRNWGAFDAVVAARLAHAPAVVHGEHGREIDDPEGRSYPRRNRLRRLCSPLVDHFVAVSHDLRRWLVDEVRIPAAKVTTIHNGVDLTRFASLDKTEARRRLGLGRGLRVIGTVGRLDPVKDQVTLIRAFRRLADDHRDAVLVIAGEGPCRGKLEAEIAALELVPRVLLLGERSDVPDVLGALDVFVLPSIAEGMSNTILEAMACRLPVVSTRVGGSPELVLDGVNGALVPPGAPEALAESLRTYLSDPERCSTQGRASRERVRQHFDAVRMSDAYADLYRRLGGAKGSRLRHWPRAEVNG